MVVVAGIENEKVVKGCAHPGHGVGALILACPVRDT